ncbi:MAG: regulatory protein RecX [Ruminococcaceae bacterium]|nr:regulatory protein RecX [Oscillospiraceae bacterium]
MKIESIAQKPDRAGRYRVELSDGKVLRLYPQTLADHGLSAGRSLTDEELKALYQDAGAVSAKMRAVRIVAATSVSAGDLEDRLRRKGETPDDAKAAVEWMRELDFVDDLSTAKQLVRRGLAKGYGVNRLRQMLYEKKIPKSLWEEALADLPEPDEEIDRFLEQRLSPEADSKELKRTIDALLRRGHLWTDIRRALTRRGQTVEHEPEE